MKKAHLLSIVALATLVPSAALATSILNNVTVTSIYIRHDGKALIQFSANPSGTRPACAQSTEGAINLSTEAGRAMLTGLNTAKLAGKMVQVAFNESCSIFGVTHQDIHGIKFLP